MRPELPQGTSRGALLALGAVAAARAVGLIALMSALAAGIAQVAAGQQLDSTSLLLYGVGGVIVRAVATWASRVIAVRASVDVKESLRARLVEHHLSNAGASGADSAVTHSESSATVVASRGLDGLDAFFRDYLPALVSTAVIPLAVLARVLWADWVSALIIVLTIPLVPVFMALIGWHTEERIQEAQEGLDRLSHHLSELARGLPVLVGLRRADAQRRALFDVSEKYRLSTAKTLRAAFMSSFALELIATISVALVAVFIGVRLVWGQLSLEDGLIALMLAPEAYMALRAVGAGFHASEDGVAALKRVNAILDADSDDANAAEAPRSLDSVPAPFDAGVAVADVYVTRGGGRESVGPVTFEALPGTVTALAGPSGCGKSSVLAVLAGVAHAQPATTIAGTVAGLSVADTRDSAEQGAAAHDAVGSNTEAPRPRGVAFQAPNFSQETPRAELALAADAGDLRKLSVADEVAALLPEEAWDRSISELSPGEKRRLAIMRAVTNLRAARATANESTTAAAGLLVLDEPTAHLDPVSAQRVRELIRAEADSGSIVVIATHDPELAEICDAFVVWEGAGQAPKHTTSRPDTVLPQRTVPSRTAAVEANSAQAEPEPSETTQAGQHEHRAARSFRKLPWRILPWGKAALWGAAALGALSVLSGGALTAVSGWLIVYASEQPPMMYLMVAIVGVRFFGLLRSTLRYAERNVTHNAVLAWASRLRVAVWDALGSNILGWQKLNRPGGAAGTLIAEVDEVRDTVPRVIVPIPAAIAAVLATCVVSWIFIPSLGWMLIALMVLGLVVAPLITLAVEQRATAVMAEHRVQVAEQTGRVMGAAPDIAAHNAVARHVAWFKNSDGVVSRAVRREALGSGVGEGLASLLGGAAALAALVLGAAAGVDPRLLALAVLLLLAVDEPLGQLAGALRQVPVLSSMLASVAPYLENRSVSEIEFESPGADDASADVQSDAAPLQVDGVRVHELSAAYAPEAPTVFGPVSGEVEQGEMWAVTGPSGSGKSTMIAVMLGFLTPLEGSVQVRADGTWVTVAKVPDAEAGMAGHESADVEAAQSAAALAGLAWCPQDGYVFDSTVRGNLALGRDKNNPVTEEEMYAALDRVGLGPWAAQLPEGLDTRTGAGGRFMSGGQRQRLAVARTLLAGARAIILDEPTAHLGADEGQDLIDDVRSGAQDVALVLVTHDQELAAQADSITRL
ncbi:thiol reductant ABC exporter subunit CydC [Pseudoglutamicibacter cumminsii]|uniref:thiol reductant ABC exporter subunit CydC n=1 Tax=Pseudoglutamicibacter cumminsii TaxID=156979 RepID=UPI00195F0CDD|nr:thiol reductant ABC exporter subunit CydC [Pseudoglutamicibacter cumminsii]MBM7795097.1 ATP-binding cassette subfamily C protein CydCD [Pseudoglutamicibacter cumminsii]